MARHWIAAMVAGFSLLAALLPGDVGAAEITLAARYRGEPSGQFRIVTPPADYCRHFPVTCARGHTMTLPITYRRTVVHRSSNLREQFYVGLPARRLVDVVNQTGQRYTLTFDMAAFGAYLVRLERGKPPMHRAKGTCTDGPATESNSGDWGTFIWYVKDPQSASSCTTETMVSMAPGTALDWDVTKFSIGFNLTMPRPVGMPQGLYRGSLDYTVGPGGDFDPGDGAADLSTSTLTINFELDVQHDLYLNFPPGSDRAVLEPPGGWSQWLGGRGEPSRLYRDLPFHLWTTGPILLYKMCQYDDGAHCGLRDRSGYQVPVETAITLPPGLASGGQPVRRLQLPSGRGNALLIDPLEVVWNQPAQVHFEVVGQAVQDMLAHPGSKFEGMTTLMFDVDL